MNRNTCWREPDPATALKRLMPLAYDCENPHQPPHMITAME